MFVIVVAVLFSFFFFVPAVRLASVLDGVWANFRDIPIKFHENLFNSFSALI